MLHETEVDQEVQKCLPLVSGFQVFQLITTYEDKRRRGGGGEEEERRRGGEKGEVGREGEEELPC